MEECHETSAFVVGRIDPVGNGMGAAGFGPDAEICEARRDWSCPLYKLGHRRRHNPGGDRRELRQ